MDFHAFRLLIYLDILLNIHQVNRDAAVPMHGRGVVVRAYPCTSVCVRGPCGSVCVSEIGLLLMVVVPVITLCSFINSIARASISRSETANCDKLIDCIAGV